MNKKHLSKLNFNGEGGQSLVKGVPAHDRALELSNL